MLNKYYSAWILLISFSIITLVLYAKDLSLQDSSKLKNINKFDNNYYSSDTTSLKRSKSGNIIQRRIQTSDSTHIIEFIDSYYGYISDILYYTNNKLDGIEQTFAPNGVIIHQIPWKNGIIVGVEQFFYEDGNIDWSRQYDTLGVLNGNLIVYYRNGMIQSKLPFANGKKDGTGYFYAPNGELLRVYSYLSDTLKKTEYLEDGIIKNVEYPNIYDPYSGK